MRIEGASKNRRLNHHALGSAEADMTSEIIPLPGRDVLEHVVDVHCHPTDEIDVSDEVMSGLSIKLCAMASHFEDQKRVADLARRYPDKVSLTSSNGLV